MIGQQDETIQETSEQKEKSVQEEQKISPELPDTEKKPKP